MMGIQTNPYKIPTKKEFRNNNKYRGASWEDVFGKAACEGCGKFFQPGETIYTSSYGKGYHKPCIPNE